MAHGEACGPSRVALLTPRFWPAIGGVERVAEGLARGLASRGLEVEVLTTDHTGHLPAIEARDGLRVRRFPAVLARRYHGLSPALGWWVLRRARRYSVLHAFSYHTPVALEAGCASALRGVPLVVTPVYHGVSHSRSPLRRALHGPYRLLAGRLLRHANAVICLTEAERQLVWRHFGRGVHAEVIPPGIGTGRAGEVARPWQPTGRKVVLTVGRLEAYKQVDRLIDAVRYLPADFELVVVGDGRERSSLEAAASRPDLAGRVRVLGSVSDEELASWYATARVFAALSMHESFGLTVAEALAAGLPVVASDIPAHREVAASAPPGRVELLPGDSPPREIASALARASGRERSGISQESPESSWEVSVDRVLDVYRRALAATCRA
ncbi:MAG: glycosyltransferase family 4 protein [Chloroflexota bacterium]|nr:glycosyltransferase family 4 protein [Chloroflexota bacterium]